MRMNLLMMLSLSLVLPTLATANPKGQLLAHNCEVVNPSEPSALTFKASKSKDTYKIGENLQLYITTEQEALVTIIDQGSDTASQRGKVLYELQPTQAQKELMLPEQGWALPVSGPAGTNILEIKVYPKALEASGNGKNVDKVRVINPAPEASSCYLSFEVVP